MIDLSNLSKQEKSELLSQLLNDPDTFELSEAEFQDRIKRVVQRLYDAVEQYLKEVDKIRSEERKNDIVNNELSNYFRGRRQDYERLFRFEGKCADALENEWTNAFYLGLECKDRITDEQLKKIRDKEKDIEMKLFGGSYDKNRVISEIYKDRNIEMLTRIIPNADNPHHDEIMDIIKEVYGKGNENT